MIDFGPATALTVLTRCNWCIWIRRKKATLPAFTAGTALPAEAFGTMNENDVLVWGAGFMTVKMDKLHFEGATKTQRKMGVGDQLVFSFVTQGAAGDSLGGQLQMQTFYKS